jgi:cellobiose phosphorylase
MPSFLFGHFDESSFVLTSEPPRKWWNLHCTAINHNGPEMYAEVAHINDGQTWIRDADGVTVNLVGYDQKYHYLRDDSSGTVFCAAGNPAPTPVQNRTVRFHREKTVMESTCEGLLATQRVFVPQHHPVECTTLTVVNLTPRTRYISIFSYAMFQLTGKDKEGRSIDKENFCTIHPEIQGVFCTNRCPDVPTNRFNGYLITLGDFFNANGYRDHFTRAEYATGTPKIIEGWNCDGRPGYGYDCAGIVQVKLTLPPHSSARADFVLGQAADVAEVKLFRDSLSPEILDRWCDEAAAVEARRAESFQIDIGHELYNGLFNIFVKKHLTNYLINKSGFRDNLQTDIALALADLPAAEANFVRALASQFPNGSVPHGFRPLNRLQYSDKPAWILQTLPALLQESGRFDLLKVEIPYFESKESGTVWDHALRAMRFLANDLGKNGLCDQHHADWNDGLEATHAAGARESVFVTMQLAYGLREMAELARRTGDTAVAKEAADLYETFKNRINTVCWDGEWYSRTHCGDGYIIGSKNCQYGKIFLNTQSWAVLSGVADPERAQAVMRKVDEILETDIGYRICFPPYAEYDPRVGAMSKSMPGANENGGCYNHAGGFKGVADCLLGRSEQAWRTFTKITPGSPENPIINSGAEPFSYVNSYSSVPYIYGKSGYAWRTGTAGWMTQLLVEYILGARRSYDGLLIAPCLPAALPEAKITRQFRGATYHIHLKNRPTGGTTPTSITLDGHPLASPTLPPATSGHFHVNVEL